VRNRPVAAQIAYTHRGEPNKRGNRFFIGSTGAFDDGRSADVNAVGDGERPVRSSPNKHLGGSLKQSTRAQLADISTALVIAGLVFMPLFWLGYAVGPVLVISLVMAAGVLMIRVALRQAPKVESLREPE